MKTRLALTFALAPAIAFSSESANYSITPLSTNAGGLRATSANYTIDGSTTPGGASSSASFTARTGYAGSLYDVLALGLTASPLTVNEGGTRQLGASLLLDDSSLLTLAPSAVTWSVPNGPLTGISSSGLAAAGAVYQDTLATIEGFYSGFTGTLDLTVINTLPDNFQTYASDGLPDDWQVQYFGLDNPSAGPALDPDGDGFDNLFEFNARLVPTDPLSSFTLTIDDIPGGGHSVTLLPRLAGCSYNLLSSSDLSLWAPVSGPVSDAGTVRTVLDPAGTGLRRFYSVSVQRE